MNRKTERFKPFQIRHQKENPVTFGKNPGTFEIKQNTSKFK